MVVSSKQIDSRSQLVQMPNTQDEKHRETLDGAVTFQQEKDHTRVVLPAQSTSNISEQVDMCRAN